VPSVHIEGKEIAGEKVIITPEDHANGGHKLGDKHSCCDLESIYGHEHGHHEFGHHFNNFEFGQNFLGHHENGHHLHGYHENGHHIHGQHEHGHHFHIPLYGGEIDAHTLPHFNHHHHSPYGIKCDPFWPPPQPLHFKPKFTFFRRPFIWG